MNERLHARGEKMKIVDNEIVKTNKEIQNQNSKLKELIK